jgi:hypothetical protein
VQHNTTMFIALDVHKDFISVAYAPEDRSAEVTFLGPVGAMATSSVENLLLVIDGSSRPPREAAGWTQKASMNVSRSGLRNGQQSPSTWTAP